MKKDNDLGLNSATDKLVSLVNSLEPLETMGHMELDFWQIVGPEPKEDPLVSQAALEYVAGLYSQMPEETHSHTRPTPDVVSQIKKQFQTIISLQVFNLARLAKVGFEAAKENVSVTAMLYFLADRDEGYPNRLWNLFEDRYARHDAAIKRILGLTSHEIIDVFRFLHSQLAHAVKEYYETLGQIVDKPLEIWRDWTLGKITAEKMLELTRTLRGNSDISRQLDEHNKRARSVALIDRSTLDEKFGRRTVESFLRRFGVSWTCQQRIPKTDRFQWTKRNTDTTVAVRTDFDPCPPTHV